MGVSRFDKVKLIERRQTVGRLYAQGQTLREIGKAVGRHEATICRDLEKIRCQWLESSIRDFDQAKADELAKIDNLEREHWEAWARSRKDKQSRTVEDSDKGGSKRSVREEGQTGDPRFLDGVLKCIERRCKLLGIDAPERKECSGPDGGPIQLTALSDEQLEAIARRKLDVEPKRLTHEGDGNGRGIPFGGGDGTAAPPEGPDEPA